MLALSAACVRTRCSPQAGSQPVLTPPSSALSPGNDGRHRMKESASCLLKQRLLSHPPSGSKGLSSASDGWAGATGWLPARGGPRWDDLSPWSPNHARHSLRRLDYPAAIVGSGMAWCPGPGPAWCPAGGGVGRAGETLCLLHRAPSTLGVRPEAHWSPLRQRVGGLASCLAWGSHSNL